jgi:hypothetical protein
MDPRTSGTLASSPNWLAATEASPPTSAPTSPTTTPDADRSIAATAITVAMVASQPGLSTMRTTRTSQTLRGRRLVALASQDSQKGNSYQSGIRIGARDSWVT